MQTRTLGRTGLEVSILGIGGFHLVELGFEEAGAILNRYLDAGGNYIETAAQYGEGESERRVGQVMAERRAGLGSSANARIAPSMRLRRSPGKRRISFCGCRSMTGFDILMSL